MHRKAELLCGRAVYVHGTILFERVVNVAVSILNNNELVINVS